MEEKFFEIEDGVLTKCTGNEKDVVIPAYVKKIYRYAFTGCTSVETISIPAGVMELGTYIYSYDEEYFGKMFGGDDYKQYNLPEICWDAFAGCASLASVSIPASVEEIGMYAFSGCTSLEEVRYTGTKEEWAAVKKEENWKAGVPARKMTCADRKALFK